MQNVTTQALASVGVTAPAGATAFHTYKARAYFLIGKTGQFAEQDLTPEQLEGLRKLNTLGTLGFQIADAA